MNSLGLYVHIPFCQSICPYCDFYKVLSHGQDKRSFVRSLCLEMQQFSKEYSGQCLETIYLGGGTPSQLSEQELALILETAQSSFAWADQMEITIECNPITMSPGYAASLKKMGFNRVSLGVQSLRDEELKQLGRLHSARQAREAYAHVRAAGFDNVSLDLMTCLLGQNEEELEENLKQYIELRPEHISAYTLTIEPNTPWGKMQAKNPDKVKELDSDTQGELMRRTQERLRQAGYEQYEISNYALSEDVYSRHNLRYWKHQDYLGVGPSAHSFCSKKWRRWANRANLEEYQRALQEGQSPIAMEEYLTPEDCKTERLMLGLRTFQGVDTIDLPKIKKQWLCDQELLEEVGSRCRLTEKGFRVYNAVVSDLLGAEEDE